MRRSNRFDCVHCTIASHIRCMLFAAAPPKGYYLQSKRSTHSLDFVLVERGRERNSAADSLIHRGIIAKKNDFSFERWRWG